MAQILVIDDDPGVRTVLQLMLQLCGHQVTLATDGVEGVKQFRNQPADIVLTDLFMPNQEGIETITELRKDFPKVPIIAMSGEMAGDTMLLVTRHLGVGAILQKPFFQDQLRAAVDRALEKAGQLT